MFRLIFLLLIMSFDSFGQNNASRINWLKEINEESYEEITNKDRVAIRFIWRRAFDNLVVIRIENVQKGVVVDSASGDYGLVQRYYAISKTRLEDLYVYGTKKNDFYNQNVNEISKEDFQKFMGVMDKLRIKQKKSAQYLIEDGSNWDFEIVVNGSYFRLETNSPDSETKAFGLEMIRLSGLKIEKDKIY